MYDRIVIAVDGSDKARKAARRGLELAQTFDASVDVLHVVEQKALRLTRTTGEKTRLREQGEMVLTEIEEFAAELGYPIITKLTEGKPAVEISEHAGEQDADLIVVGRQGLTGVGRRYRAGSPSKYCPRARRPRRRPHN